MKTWRQAWRRCRSGSLVAALAVALGAALSGCGLFTEEGPCTLIGCESGLTLRIDGAPAPMTLHLRLPDGSVLARECTPESCAHGTLFRDVRARSV
jgi:hypothetical protein